MTDEREEALAEVMERRAEALAEAEAASEAASVVFDLAMAQIAEANGEAQAAWARWRGLFDAGNGLAGLPPLGRR